MAVRGLAWGVVAWALIAHGVAHAEPQFTLRMASVVPEGTSWAREMKALARDVSQTTHDEVRLKWYLGGIAGDDVEAGQRIKRDQLDGVAAGVWQCERWAPSMKVTRLPGLYRTRDESRYVAARLRATFDEELHKAGFIYVGESQVGPSLIFLRNPVKTFDELKKVKLWSLDVDVTKRALLTALGLTLIPLPFDKSRKAFDDGEVDGFLAPATGAMAFQWSTQARNLVTLPTDWILGCVVIAARAFDKLPIEHQREVRGALAKFGKRFDEVGEHADDELLGGLFERQGVKLLKLDDRFRADFEAASRAAWTKVDEKLIPRALVEQVTSLLEAYRAGKR
jgi:TRAP-type C4-dicarboxylate transport system substrate-binding protein